MTRTGREGPGRVEAEEGPTWGLAELGVEVAPTDLLACGLARMGAGLAT